MKKIVLNSLSFKILLESMISRNLKINKNRLKCLANLLNKVNYLNCDCKSFCKYSPPPAAIENIPYLNKSSNIGIFYFQKEEDVYEERVA
ncbi:hypothetical protein CPAV1605_1090 [seawater metagenome]|uniref:Uncharacterized protein n=1 Tax=seawater metagenome TaxID=1561972 RepID=A0A5E8CKT8_9ZZZZ